ncbi:MAG: hypothetical protein NTW07_01245 [candidate division Zixibacteria bacterium]|nr:hypothetical protein [candidate division Zixibacteria bacterium]
MAASVRSGSFLIVTCDVEPEDPSKDIKGDIGHHRYNELQRRVGQEKIPNDVKPKDLSKWGLGKVSRRIITDQIDATSADRNAPLADVDKVRYSQLINIHYRDGTHGMLTVGGTIATEADDKKLKESAIGDLDIVRTGDEAFEIEIPVLTWRELRLLDGFLPDDKQSFSELPKWLSKDLAQQYARIYRHFQNFVEVES